MTHIHVRYNQESGELPVHVHVCVDLDESRDVTGKSGVDCNIARLILLGYCVNITVLKLCCCF